MSEPESGYTATDLYSEYGQRWHIYWARYLDGRQLTADDRLDPTVTFTRSTPAAMRDCLAQHEAEQAARARK